MSKACVLLAPGFEEIEATTIIDVLRRGQVETTTLGVEGRSVEGAHGITLEADATLAEGADQPWDLVVLPGGMPGSTNLRDSDTVRSLLQKQHERGGKLGAICAAPIALSAAGLLEGRKATSYPSFADQLRCAEYREDGVVIDGPVVTSRGPATALRFALSLLAELRGKDVAAEIALAMLVPQNHLPLYGLAPAGD